MVTVHDEPANYELYVRLTKQNKGRLLDELSEASSLMGMT